MRSGFTEELIDIIRAIPRGRVATYGGIAAWAGNPRAAREVARVLNSCSESEGLPWWRVINKAGSISLPRGDGFETQRERLEAEGVEVDAEGRIDLNRFLSNPDWMEK